MWVAPTLRKESSGTRVAEELGEIQNERARHGLGMPHFARVVVAAPPRDVQHLDVNVVGISPARVVSGATWRSRRPRSQHDSAGIPLHGFRGNSRRVVAVMRRILALHSIEVIRSREWETDVGCARESSGGASGHGRSAQLVMPHPRLSQVAMRADGRLVAPPLTAPEQVHPQTGNEHDCPT